MRVLVVNSGSSSLKLALVDGEDQVAWSTQLEAEAGRADPDAVAAALEPVGTPDAAGHRVVHGGTRYSAGVRIDAGVLRELHGLGELAPLHQPAAVAAMELVGRLLPSVPAVACFDTAFHADLPAAAWTYALPTAWRERYGLRRYGFHGLSHAWAARRAAALTGRPLAELRTVTCHLGAGASLAAVRGGRSVDTTMGFTPVEGLVMATRSGSVDPGMVLWLAEPERLGLAEVTDGLSHRSGLAGLAGTPDMRAVVRRAGAGEADARLALEVYGHRLRASVAAMAAAMDGLDVLVFTGGVGEHEPAVRAAAAAGLGFLGLALDEAANAAAVPDADVTASRARVRTLVVAAREDLEIAAEVRRVLGG